MTATPGTNPSASGSRPPSATACGMRSPAAVTEDVQRRNGRVRDASSAPFASRGRRRDDARGGPCAAHRRMHSGEPEGPIGVRDGMVQFADHPRSLACPCLQVEQVEPTRSSRGGHARPAGSRDLLFDAPRQRRACECGRRGGDRGGRVHREACRPRSSGERPRQGHVPFPPRPSGEDARQRLVEPATPAGQQLGHDGLGQQVVPGEPCTSPVSEASSTAPMASRNAL